MRRMALIAAAIFALASLPAQAQQLAENGIPPSVTSVTPGNPNPGIPPSVTSMHAGWGGSMLAAQAAGFSADDSNPLKPPRGYKVALVEFADYECPDCANAEPILEQAERTYHIPLVRYDFPLTKHPWSKDAAVMARFFDTKSKALGDEFRKYCYEHQPYPDKKQPQIVTPADLRKAAEQFAAAHHVTLPMAIDPEGKLVGEVDHDLALGQEIGINHTPTIYVVTNSSQGKPFVEVVDRSNLFSQIDEMISEAGGVREAAAGHKAARKSHSGAH